MLIRRVFFFFKSFFFLHAHNIIFTAHDLCFPPLALAMHPVGQSSFEKFAITRAQSRREPDNIIMLYYSDIGPRRWCVLVVTIIIHNIMYTINRYDVPVYNYNLFDAHK